MPYNTNMYNTYGQMYGNSYGNSYGAQYPQQTMPMQMPQSGAQSFGAQAAGIDWVDGEAAARASQLPPGTTQHAMWDINEPVIYVKSVNQMGMPNPLQKLRYTMEEQPHKGMGQSQAKLTSGETEPEEQSRQDMSEYIRRDEIRTEDFVRKDDLDRMKHELMDSIQNMSTSGTTARRTAKGE